MSDITQLVELWIRPSKMTGKNSSKALDIRKRTFLQYLSLTDWKIVARQESAYLSWSPLKCNAAAPPYKLSPGRVTDN